MKVIIIIAVGLLLAILVLFHENSDQAHELTALRERFEQADQKASETIKQFEDEGKDKEQRLERLTEELHAQNEQVSAVRTSVEQNQATLNSLKADIAKGVQSDLLKEVTKNAAVLLSNSVKEDKSLAKDPVFVKAVAEALVENFRQDLRGAAGADADNAVVAKMLAADTDFLNRVSVSAVMHGNSSPDMKNR